MNFNKLSDYELDQLFKKITEDKIEKSMKKNGKKQTNSNKLSMEKHQIKKFKSNLSYLVVVPVIGEELQL